MNHTFTVPGPPVGKERPRVTRRGTYTPAKTRGYEMKVRTYAVAARIPRIDGDVWLSVAIYFPDRRHRDGDNVIKSIADSLNGLAYKDDSQIKEWHGAVHVDRSNPRVVVWVGPRGGE